MVRTFLYKIARIYWFILRPIVLGSRAIVVRNGRVLLVRLTYVNGWYLPGGGVDRGESFREAVVRELREECGIEAEEPKFFGLYFTRKQGKIDHVAIYVVERFNTIAGAKPDAEIAEMREFDPRDLPEDTSPATRRRIEEYLRGTPTTDQW